VPASKESNVVQLNEQQQAVIDFIDNGTGSLNLIARAGCGKTFTLMQAVARIHATTKDNVAVMAYNASIAREFKEKLDQMGLTGVRVTAGTVHSFGNRAWRQVAPKAQLEEHKVRNICDRFAQQERNGQRRGVTFTQFGNLIDKLVDLAKQAAFGISHDVNDTAAWEALCDHHDLQTNGHTEEIVEGAQEVYQVSLDQAYQVMDFADMILLPLYFDVKVQQYAWVLIDEAQDTNESRRLLALKCLRPGGRVIAVGDPRQAIYGFTGADSNSLDLIRNVLNSAELPLSITYRCPKAVVREANRLVPDLLAHESAPEGVVRSIAKLDPEKGPWFRNETLSPNDVALCRNTRPLLEEAYKLIGAHIACRVEGRDIGEGLIALATKWKRAVTLGALQDQLASYKMTEMAKWIEKKNEARAQSVEDRVDTLNVIINHLLAEGSTSVNDLVNHVRNLFGTTKDGEKPKVFTFSTIHKAKGREWNRVYFLFRGETIPSKWAKQDWQLDQEANLEYVAITRSKEELVYVS
jgi:superfamily I DNA/RNA helicase